MTERWWIRLRIDLADERGQYLVYTAMALVLVVVLLGLAIDGGFMFREYRRVRNVASLAAQAASHAVDEAHFTATNEVRLDVARATGIALNYAEVNSRGAMEVTRVVVWADGVAVDVEERMPTIFMQVVGIPEVRIAARGVARPRYGIESAPQ